jgi:hypothetical protein
LWLGFASLTCRCFHCVPKPVLGGEVFHACFDSSYTSSRHAGLGPLMGLRPQPILGDPLEEASQDEASLHPRPSRQFDRHGRRQALPQSYIPENSFLAEEIYYNSFGIAACTRPSVKIADTTNGIKPMSGSVKTLADLQTLPNRVRIHSKAS